MKCIIKTHESFDTVGICINIDCDLKTRLVCPKCLISYHSEHMTNIILFNDILDTKEKDEFYLQNIPEINEFKKISKEFENNKDNYQQILNKVELNTSTVYDIVLSNFENMNLGLKKALEVAYDVDIEQACVKMKEFEENNLYNITEKLINKSFTNSEYEDIVSNTVVQNLKELKLSLSKRIKKEINNTKRSEMLDGHITQFYAELKKDLITLFKSYNEKICYIDSAINPFVIQLRPNNHCSSGLGVKLDTIFKDGLYTITKKAMCLIGNRPFMAKEKFKLVFENASSFSCVGFGIGSLSDPKIEDVLSINSNNVLLCLCCNGPWSAKGMKVSSTNVKLSTFLLSDVTKEVIYEFDKVSDRFRVYDAKNNLHAEIAISSLPLKDDLTFIMNCTSGVNLSFRIINFN